MIYLRSLLSYFLLAAVLIGLPGPLRSQGYKYDWFVLNQLPERIHRYNDISFVTPLDGWIIAPSVQSVDSVLEYGRILRTGDGGYTWHPLVDSALVHFRAMQMVDRSVGYLGSYGPVDGAQYRSADSIALFNTSDGGGTWEPIREIAGPWPKGICAIDVVTESTIYACGRFGGPAHFVKTTNSGAFWTSQNIQDLMGGAVDCKFYDADTGILVGISEVDYSAIDPYLNSRPVIIRTTDAGQSWTEQYRGHRTKEWCWKISWPSYNTIYVSLESVNTDSLCVLKSEDAGMTWRRVLVTASWSKNIQGIGFINDTIGWIAGRTKGGFKTTDGGRTWSNWGSHTANRFRFMVGDSLGWVAGQQASKLVITPNAAVLDGVQTDEVRIIHSTSGPVLITRFHEPTEMSFKIIDVLGRTLFHSPELSVSSGSAKIALPHNLLPPLSFVLVTRGTSSFVLRCMDPWH